MSEETIVKVPNIGGAAQVEVIEVLVQPGDVIQKETPLITLESDKASMEIPSPKAGKVKEVRVKVGDKVSEDGVILILEKEVSDAENETEGKDSHQGNNTSNKPNESVQRQDSKISSSQSQKTAPMNEREDLSSSKSTDETEKDKPPTSSQARTDSEKSPSINEMPSSKEDQAYAGPAIRRMAREFGVNLSEVSGSGRKGRISASDLQKYVKEKLIEKSDHSLNLPQLPAIDFSQFGSIEMKPLSKIKRLTGVHVHRSWINIPHVTQFDQADITELEAFRKSEEKQRELNGYRLTLLAFVTKVISKALAVFPQFNSSLDPSGEKLIYKNYYHIGIAVETSNGLVVPVLRDVNQLSVREIAIQMGKISTKAREKGLTPNEMSGGCFTISSLGGIGGTAFTPIVNSPEVAILGLSRSVIKPIYIQEEFQPRLVLPLSLSYDHRVIDGAEAARFTRFIAESLEDIRRILL